MVCKADCCWLQSSQGTQEVSSTVCGWGYKAARVSRVGDQGWAGEEFPMSRFDFPDVRIGLFLIYEIDYCTAFGLFLWWQPV